MQEKSMSSSPTEEEGVAKTTCDELIAAPSPCPLASLVGRALVSIRNKEDVTCPGLSGHSEKYSFGRHSASLLVLLDPASPYPGQKGIAASQS
ncbi:hypothetical protein HGM15179_004142 [Zosterops borbonicus]|uniref:Uncharacterized protein n=1 Tax=Zosterops borbonicus TaxID=364589 RepID=A0A8K1GRX9_9PASS|nr:hypothetical protein HGM15179_004142 [Zosterops borbonicus]